MAEIIKPIYVSTDSEGKEIFIIEGKHSIADILRLCQQEGWWDEMMSLVAIEKETPKLGHNKKFMRRKNVL